MKLCHQPLTEIIPIIRITKIVEAMGTVSYKVQEIVEHVGKRKPNEVSAAHTLLKY